jgi:hypothetical protein
MNRRQLKLAQKAQHDLSGKLHKIENRRKQLHDIKQLNAEQTIEMNDLDFALFDTKSRLENAKADVSNFKKALPINEIPLSGNYVPEKPSSTNSRLLNQLTHETHELASKTNSLLMETTTSPVTTASSVSEKRTGRYSRNTGAQEKSPTYEVQMSPRDKKIISKKAAQMRKEAKEAEASEEAKKLAAEVEAKNATVAKKGLVPVGNLSGSPKSEGEVSPVYTIETKGKSKSKATTQEEPNF